MNDTSSSKPSSPPSAPPNLFTTIVKNVFYGMGAMLFLAFIGLVRVLPHRVVNALAGNLFWTFGRFTKKHRVILKNLAWVYPHWGHQKYNVVRANVWRNVGYIFVDMMRARVNRKSVTIQGADHYLNALKQGRGVMLITPHLGAWEISASVVYFVSNTRPHGIYRRAKSPLFDWVMNKMRNKNAGGFVEKNDPKVGVYLMRLFKNNKTLVMLPDQKKNDGIETTFFNRPSMTPEGAGLFMQKGIPTVPLHIIRDPKNSTKYQAIFYPPLTPVNTGDKAKDTLTAIEQMNSIFEDWIHQNPDQYFWIHRRWDKSFYK